MSEMRRLALRGSALQVILLLANLGVAFYLMPFLVHALGDRWYGMWTLVGTLMGYYGYLDFGLSVATQRYIAHALGKNDTPRVNRLTSTAFLVFAAMGLLILIVTIAIATVAPLFFSAADEIFKFRIVLLILGLSLAINFPMAAFNGLLSGSMRYDIASYIELFKLVLRTVLIVYCINAGYSIIALAAITLAVGTVGNGLRVMVAHRMFRELNVRIRHYTRQTMGELFGYGSKTFVNQLADLMRFQLDHLVISAFIGLSAVTVFNIAGQLVYYFRVLMASLLGVLTPLFARYQAAEDATALHKMYFFTSKLAAAAATLIGGAMVIFGREFIRLWMGPEYLDAYAVLVVLTIPTALFVAQFPGHTLIYGLGEVGTLAKVSIVEALSNLALSIVLVSRLGLLGVAIGTAVPLVFYALFVMVFSCRLVKARAAEYLHRVGTTFFVTVSLQVISWFIVEQMNVGGYTDLFLLFIAVYSVQVVVTLYLVFSAAELKLIWETALGALGFMNRAPMVR